MKARLLLALPLIAGLAAPLAVDAFATPAQARNNPGNATGNPGTGNNGRGPNPSRGNAGRNSGSSSVSSSVMAPRIRFAPGRR